MRRPVATLAARWARRRLPARTIRLRLTVLYGGLFLASGAALLAINYILVAHRYTGEFFVTSAKGVVFTGTAPSRLPPAKLLEQLGPGKVTPADLLAQAHAQSGAALHQLLVQSALALAIMALISIWLGWVVAGRALRPLRTITSAAREISATNLHRRLALHGPDDELKQLATTFDGLLERLEAAFAAQRQFVANASHELRTPLTLERAIVEVALADPGATVESLREACRQVLDAGEEQERLIEALLTLSRSQRGLDVREPVDVQGIAGDALESAAGDGLRLDARLAPCRTSGDPRLVERLVANLVGNAVRHNVPGGRVSVTTETASGRAILTVANSGPVIPPAQLGRLFQPFQRLDGGRSGHANGVGLGLSIVQAIATAHTASLTARALPRGGLEVAVDFPALPAGPLPS